MRAKFDFILRILIALCAAGVIAAFFQPWVKGPGGPVSAPHLRETLEGPHKLLSLFKQDNRVSLNYRLAPYLWALPASAGMTLVLTLIPGGPALPALVTGGVAWVSTAYFQSEVRQMPFHREGPGVGLTQRLGYLLLLFSVLRIPLGGKGRRG